MLAYTTMILEVAKTLDAYAYFCIGGGSEFEAIPTPPPAFAHRIAILAHTLREGFTVRRAKSYCEVQSVIIFSIPKRQIESQSSARAQVI
jgi:hypothetical protein